MIFCKVTGTIVATRKHEALRKGRLLIVRPVALDGSATDARDLLAIDPHLGAGEGDTVLVAKEGAVVAQLLGSAQVPANAIIVGIVDDWAVQ
ncbi:MAG: EutN/CcmL family microcompartment protein [Rhodothermales bacterium]